LYAARPTHGLDVAEAEPPTEASQLAALTLDGGGPVWLQIRRTLAQPILDGRWPPGARIPGEIVLKDHFRTSRTTVSKAIQSLAADGLVQRRRKVGTVVAERAQDRPVLEIWNTADVIERSGAEYAYRLLKCEFVKDDPDKRRLLHARPSTQLLSIRCLHLSNGAPFQLEERLVNVEAAPGISCRLLETQPPGPWLLAHVPWTEAEHTIAACEAGPAEAEALDVPVGSACLVVERKTWNDDLPVTVARLWHSGAQHRLVGRFAPAR
jgi:GntR family histidine utilization transcriptional repressor